MICFWRGACAAPKTYHGFNKHLSQLDQDLRSWTIFGGAPRPQKSSKHWVFRSQCVSPVDIAIKGLIRTKPFDCYITNMASAIKPRNLSFEVRLSHASKDTGLTHLDDFRGR